MNGRNSTVPSSATSNGLALSRMTATSGIASRLTCVPNWLMVSPVHSRTKSRLRKTLAGPGVTAGSLPATARAFRRLVAGS